MLLSQPKLHVAYVRVSCKVAYIHPCMLRYDHDGNINYGFQVKLIISVEVIENITYRFFETKLKRLNREYISIFIPRFVS